MKRILYFLSALLLGSATASAKKVKLTIDGTTTPSEYPLYLIINEDTLGARQISREEGKFSITLTVERDAFIRIQETKKYPERCYFVLIPDSKHITINMRAGRIEGSQMSLNLRSTMLELAKMSPESFHIDVFSDDREAWRQANEQARVIQNNMRMQQIKMLDEFVEQNNDNILPAWLIYANHSWLDERARIIILRNQGKKWTKHVVLQKSGILDKK